MKHVWILNHYALEPGGAGGTRHYSLARHLLSNGWRTSIVAASVELNSGRQRLNSNETYRLQVFDGIPFLWVRTPQYEGNGMGRMRNMLAYALRVLVPAITRDLDRPDVILGSSVHPLAALSGALLARRYGVPFVFEVRDLWPQTLIDMGRLHPRSGMTRLLQWLEKWLYRRADRIVALLPRANEYIVPLGIAEEKIAWIPNGVELQGSLVAGPPSPKATFTLMYFGAHGQANGLDNLLEAMAVLKRKSPAVPVTLRLIGDGPQKQALQMRAAELALDNVHFEPPVSKREIPTLAAEADAFVFNLIDAPVFRFGISSNKLFDFLAAARPIIFSCAASNNPVEEAGAGITVPPGNSADLARAIIHLVALPPEERAKMGHAGRAYVETNHSYAALSARLAGILDAIFIAK